MRTHCPFSCFITYHFPHKGQLKKKNKELKHSLFIPFNCQGFQSLLVEIVSVTCKKRILPYMLPAAENNCFSPTEELLSPWQQVNLRYKSELQTPCRPFAHSVDSGAWFCSPGKCQHGQQLRPPEPQDKCGADQTLS